MKRLLFLLLSLRLLAADSLFTLNETTAFYNTTNSGTIGAAGAGAVGGALTVGGNLTGAGTLAITGGATFGTNITATGGPLIRATANISTSTTLDRTHYNVMVSDSGGNVTITLPAAADYTGHEYRICKRAGSNRTVITAQSGELIGGIVNSIPLPLLSSVTLESNGTQWHMVESPLGPLVSDITTSTTLNVGDFNVTVNDTAGNVTLTLPSATNYSLLGRLLYIHKRAGTNTTTIDPAGSELIDSDSTLVVPYRGSVVLQSDLTSWRSVARSFPLAADTISLASIDLGNADTRLSRQSAGVVALGSVPVIDAAVGTLAYSGTTVNITAGKGVAQEDTLTCTNSFSLTFSSLNNKDAGYVTIWPAATNCTITLPSYGFGPSGSTLTVNGGTGNTNYTVLTWFNTVVGGTNRVSVNALNYYR